MNNTTEQIRNLTETCIGLKGQLIFFIEAFLWIALVVALLTALADLAVKLAPLFKQQGFPPARTAVPVDPIKFIDALKGLIDALTKAPAWIAMFLAAMGLLWISQYQLPKHCF
jgi:hypothetical protein